LHAVGASHNERRHDIKASLLIYLYPAGLPTNVQFECVGCIWEM